MVITAWIIMSISTVWAGFCILGYMTYKLEKLDSWTDGLKMVFTVLKDIMSSIGKGLVFCIEFCYTGFTGKLPDGQIINHAFILTQKEATDLTNRFHGKPYDLPFTEDIKQNCNGILWMEIVAVGLTTAYKNLTSVELKEVAIRTIQNFYFETRGIVPPVYIKVATEKRLYFAIPLCAEGEAFLKKQDQYQGESSFSPEEPLDLFDEEIPELDHEKGDAYDLRL